MMSSCVLQLLQILTSNKADSTCRKIGETLRRPAAHAILLHCRTKPSRIAPSNKIMDVYTQLFPKVQIYFTSLTRAPEPIPYIITIPKFALS